MVPLGELAEWGSGGTPSRKNPSYFGEGIPWLSIADLNDGLVSDARESLTPAGLSASTAKVVPAGTVFVAMYGSIGKLGVATRDLCTSQAIAFARPHTDLITTRFLFHSLKAFRGQLTLLGRGGTQSNIGQRDLKRLEIPLPPLDEQRRITAILDHSANLEGRIRDSIGLLSSLPGSLFAKSFSGSGLNTIQFGDLVADHQLGLDRKSSDLGPDRAFPYLKMDAITSTGGLDTSRITRANCEPSESAKYSLEDGDLLFNTRNTQELVGKSAIYRGPKSLFNNNILRLRFHESVEVEYIHQFLWSPFGRQQLSVRKSGTTSVWAIYLKSLQTIEVPIPDKASQTLFSDRVRAIRMQLQRLREIEARQDLVSKSLQYRAFRGEL